MNSFWNGLARPWHRLRGLKASPKNIALGFALGFFVGWIPLVGIKTALALILAWVTRSHKIAAVIGVTLHDLFLPFAPFVLRIEYVVGSWLLSHPHRFPQKIHHEHMSLGEFLDWTRFLEWLFTVGKPLLLGAVATGIPVGIAAYFLCLGLVVHWRKQTDQRGGPPGD
ncbi:MAG: DUF2062 domain-containing protein [Verrucomicrobiae bacterium]|nr:DUF2062 domain-containing protein [Verrucomicrobiae bacterium]